MPDYIIIGSGFGASVCAARLTEAGKTVAIMEMGERWTVPGTGMPDTTKMRQSQDTKYIYRLFRDYPDFSPSNPALMVTQGMGYGGGSLVYSGIHLRAPSSAFSGWPTGYTRANLDPYYARVEGNLHVAQDPATFNYPRPSVFNQGAQAAGLGAAQALPLAMSGCVHCGWCVPNCIYGKKMTMPQTYLKRAEATGRLSVYTNYKCSDIAVISGGYRVYLWYTGVRADKYHLVNSGTWYYMDAPRVIIAAGAIESPCILQRSLWNYNEIYSWSSNSWLGYGLDGQGDAVVGGFVPQTTSTYKGAIMMSQVDRGNYVLQDIHGIPVGPTVKYPVTFNSIGNATWGLAYKRKMRQYGTNMLAVAIIGQSPSGGNITVQDNGGIPALSTAAYQPPAGAVAAAKSIITALGGEVANTPYELSGQIATVHPTGGCKMGAVVDPHSLQVYNNPGLYVIDGSVIPSSTFRNPSNTIAAIAEKTMDVHLNVPGAPTW